VNVGNTKQLQVVLFYMHLAKSSIVVLKSGKVMFNTGQQLIIFDPANNQAELINFPVRFRDGQCVELEDGGILCANMELIPKWNKLKDLLLLSNDMPISTSPDKQSINSPVNEENRYAQCCLKFGSKPVGVNDRNQVVFNESDIIGISASCLAKFPLQSSQWAQPSLKFHECTPDNRRKMENKNPPPSDCY